MRRSRPTSIRWARRRRCYPTKAEEGHFASHVLGCKVPWNREVLQGRRWRHHPPRGQGPTPRGVDESRRTVAWQANAPALAQASACAFRIVDSLPCLRERPLPRTPWFRNHPYDATFPQAVAALRAGLDAPRAVLGV